MRPLLFAVLLLAPSLATSGCVRREVVRDVVREGAVEREARDGPVAVVAVDSAAVEAAVRAVLDAQVAAWNDGNVRGFMDGYWRSRDMTFLSGGSVRRGWQDALYAYVRSYPDRASMGTLTFSDLTVRPLSPASALVWGRWRLARADDAPGGLFTLLLEEIERPTGERVWRVVHDHTSAE